MSKFNAVKVSGLSLLVLASVVISGCESTGKTLANAEAKRQNYPSTMLPAIGNECADGYELRDSGNVKLCFKK